MASANLLICKEDPLRPDSFSQPLRARGYRVAVATCDEEGHALLLERSPDLILIESATGGSEYLREVRKHTTAPIIVVTKLSRAADRVGALQNGADDAISEPADLDEVEARIQAVLRRTRPVLGGLDLVIDDLRKEVRVSDRTVSLSPKEFRLLKLLASSPGRVFTGNEILAELWPRTTSSYATEQDVQKYVYLLRRKIEEDPKRPKLILTARGFGYRLAV